MTASCCQGGENTVLQLPRSPQGAEMVLVRSLGGPAAWLYQILMFLYCNTNADAWNICLHQLLIYRCHMARPKQNNYTAASRG